MIDQATLKTIQFLFGAIVFTVIGPLLVRDGIRQVRGEKTIKERQSWLQTRLFININGCRWLLGMPRKTHITRSEAQRLGWLYVAIGASWIMFGLYAWMHVIRLALSGD